MAKRSGRRKILMVAAGVARGRGREECVLV
jgi:hypothetical protein